MAKTKYYRHLIVVDLLNTDKEAPKSITDVAYAMTEGGSVGDWDDPINVAISPTACAALLEIHGSEPSFLLTQEDLENLPENYRETPVATLGDYSTLLKLARGSGTEPITCWKCPQCGERSFVPAYELADIGTPMCTECEKGPPFEVEMEPDPQGAPGMVQLDDQELATILSGLRALQALYTVADDETTRQTLHHHFPEHFENVEPPTQSGIDDLCLKLNTE